MRWDVSLSILRLYLWQNNIFQLSDLFSLTFVEENSGLAFPKNAPMWQCWNNHLIVNCSLTILSELKKMWSSYCFHMSKELWKKYIWLSILEGPFGKKARVHFLPLKLCRFWCVSLSENPSGCPFSEWSFTYYQLLPTLKLCIGTKKVPNLGSYSRW